MHSISQCLGGLLWSYWRGLGVVKLVGAVRVKNGSPTGGRKGEMAVRPTCAICIYCFICSAFHMQWILDNLLCIYPTGVSKWNSPVIGQLYLRDGSSPGKYMRLMASNWRPRRSSWCPQKSPLPQPPNHKKYLQKSVCELSIKIPGFAEVWDADYRAKGFTFLPTFKYLVSQRATFLCNTHFF